MEAAIHGRNGPLVLGEWVSEADAITPCYSNYGSRILIRH